MTVELRCFLICGCLCALVPPSLADDAARPARLAVEPNAILRLEDPLTIEVEGVKKGERVRLEVYDDCLAKKRECPRLYERDSEPANKQGVVRVLQGAEGRRGGFAGGPAALVAGLIPWVEAVSAGHVRVFGG